MSKQKLAELVMQKMKQKKQEEERNRPHYQMLQLFVKFEVEDYQLLTKDIAQLQSLIAQQQLGLNTMTGHGQSLDNTGKKNYPRFIIKPQFIASEHIPALTKQFYRKTSNTFLREDLLKHKKYEADCLIFQQIQQKYQKLKQMEEQTSRKLSNHIKTTNQKRARNLKQDLRLRALWDEIKNIQATIDQEKEQNKSLISEYELKKTNLNQRIDWKNDLQHLITKQKQLIQSVYNPVSYRDYLKRIFGVRIKNQLMHKNLLKVMKQVSCVEQKTEKNQRFLEKTDNLFIIGKCSDSPSKKKRKRVSSQQSRRPPKSYRKQTPMNKSEFSSVKNHSAGKSQYDKTFSTSLGKTTAGSTTNLFTESSKKKRSMSNSVEFRKPKKQTLQY